ncbi:Aminotransferase-like, plant mobile domain family protein [Prunus dulcis]|uniref:Aminotransferase-like, plant mobile domain family protein n=1 Tax=Prunus dulcis TaxID=3755 RepID=A0A5H2XQQ9_PRUDU|nr:Aminotransferase-like, plant mobile domain family protein [Prunus dulcis]
MKKEQHEMGKVANAKLDSKNTGEDVQLDRPVEDEKVKQLVKSFGGNGKRVLVKGLAEQLEKCENANEDFKVRFVMFALGTVLCPTSSPSVTGKYLTFLTIPGMIETKNWADHGFNFLCEGVRSFKAKKVAYFGSSNTGEVKRSIEGLALGQIIQAEVQRSVLELTDKVMSQVRSFMKDARHEDVNQTKEDGLPKIRDEGGENVVKKKVENWRGKEEFTKLARGDQSRIQTRRTAKRRPGLHCREPWVDPSNAKGKVVQKTASKIKIGPFKLKPEDLQDFDFESNNFSSEEVIIEIENEHHVTRDEFMCLRPEMWINDRVLNAQEQVNNTSDGKLFELGVKLRREISKRFTVGLKKYEKIFIPILDRIRSHWYLLVVLMGDKKVELWDSLPGVKYNASRYQLAERIFAKFNIVRTDKARRQLNDAIVFQHASERVRVALSLLKNPKNTRLKEVRESARRVVDEELDKLAEHGPSIPHHPIARKPMTSSQAK